MGRPWVLDPQALDLLGRSVRAGAGALLRRAAGGGEPVRALRRALEPATRERVRREVLTPERIDLLARTLRDETAELVAGAAGRAAAVPGVREALDPEARRLVAQISALVAEAATTPVDPDSAERDGEELIRSLAPLVDALMRRYFRLEVEGIERVPKGPALLVANHDTGTSFVQPLGMGARWYLERGLDERLVGLMHDALFEVPVVANLMGHLGAVRASHKTADEALARGAKVFVAPGGNLEAFRPYRERHIVKFGGRRGWIRLARRNGVPIVPVVFIGGQETFFVLADGEYLAHNLGLKRRFRIDTLPIWIGLPYGVGIGPLFHLPLPAKCKVRFLDPVPVDDDRPGESESEAESRIYDLVTSAMQEALSEMAAERSLPVLG